MRVERTKKSGLLLDTDGSPSSPDPGGISHRGRTKVEGGRV